MKSDFSYHEYFPGIYHINDMTKVNFTLIIPEEQNRALLFDSGYGYVDPKPFLLKILKRHRFNIENLTVLMSHAHHDHILGGRWFDSFYIHESDIPFVAIYTAKEYRGRSLMQVKEKKYLPDDFDESSYYSADYSRRVNPGIPSIEGIQILHIPGHTPGSLVLYIPRYKLIMTADNWNPTTWVFFPEALSIGDYAKSIRDLLPLDFEYVLCSHSNELMPGRQLRNYINGLVPSTFEKAQEIKTPYPQIMTLLCHPEPGTNLVFRKEGGNYP
jgi:glyoxylase-like metal-dependent hydrolase (beta-lactamase superfamily II)